MPLRSTTGVALALLAVLLLGACGDDGSKQELSSDRAAALRAALDEVEQGVESGDCTGAVAQTASFRARVDGLPDRVDGDLRRALSASADRLETLVADQCRPATPAPVEEPPVGTTTEEEVPPEGEQDQQDKPAKDKKPKKEKPNEEPPPDTGGAGEEDPNLGEQGGGVPPGQE